MLTEPRMEEMLPKAACAYELAVLVSKRANQLVEGAQPMISEPAANMVSLACKEIAEGKVVGVKGNLKKGEYAVPLTKEAREAISAEKKAREEAEAKAEELLSRLPKAEKRIALCVKGTFALKTWPKEYFVEVVEALAKRYDAAFFVVGAPNDREYADEVIAGMNRQSVMNFCGETNLVDLAALIRKADLLITVDTGATHIAATTGVKMITMYGCTSPDRWHPINKNAHVLTSRESCCPCSVREDECPSSPRPMCLWNIQPEEVLEICYEMLK